MCCPRMLRPITLLAAILVSGSAAAQCYRWLPAHGHDLTTTLLPVVTTDPPRSLLVRLRGATLPRYEGGCGRETLFAQLSKAKILIETGQTADLLFCQPEQEGDVVVATVLVNGRDLAAVLAEQDLAQTGVSRGWCGDARSGR